VLRGIEVIYVKFAEILPPFRRPFPALPEQLPAALADSDTCCSVAAGSAPRTRSSIIAEEHQSSRSSTASSITDVTSSHASGKIAFRQPTTRGRSPRSLTPSVSVSRGHGVAIFYKPRLGESRDGSRTQQLRPPIPGAVLRLSQTSASVDSILGHSSLYI